MTRSLRFSPFFLLLILWLSGPQQARAQAGCSFTLDPLLAPYACLGGQYTVCFSAPCLTGNFRVEISQAAPPFPYNFSPPRVISFETTNNCITIDIPTSLDTNVFYGIRVKHMASGQVSNIKPIQVLPQDTSGKPITKIEIVRPIKTIYCPTDSILFGIDTLILKSFNPPPTYQWYYNGQPAGGATRPQFVYNNWKPGDNVSLLITKGNRCATNDIGFSDTIRLRIAKKPRATLVLAGRSSGCADSANTFRLDTADVGFAPTFKWFINGVVVPGATGVTFAYAAGQANCNDKVMGRVYTAECPDSATGGPFALRGCGKVRVDNVRPLTSCAGDSLHIDYSTLACFDPSNVFTFELSDENGDFTNAVVLGSIADSNGGSFHAISPENLRGGFRYHIRIRSSAPAGLSQNISDTLEIYNRPGSPFPQNAQRCGPGKLTLAVNVVGAASYAWYTTQRGFGDVRVRYRGPGGSQGGGALVTTDTFTIDLLQDTAFYVVAISPFGCESRIRSTVRGTINPPLVVTAGPDQQACEGGSCVPLTGASPGPGTWTGNGVSNGQFCPGTLPAGSYTVQYKYVSSEGCADSATKSVVINSIPAPEAGTPDSTVCVPGPPFRFTLHGATPVGGIWSGSPALLDNQGTYNPSLMPTTRPDTVYYTIIQSGCSRSDFRVLRAQPAPVFTVNTTNATACLSPTGSASVVPFDPATQTAEFFNLSLGTVQPSTDGFADTLRPGRYRVTVTTNGITCETEQSFVIDDPGGPDPHILNLPAAYCSNDGLDTLTADISGGRWESVPANLVNTLTGEFNPSNAPSGPITIFYTFRDAGTQCLGADTGTTVVNPSPGVPPEADTTVCQNAGLIPLSGGGLWSGNGVVPQGGGQAFDPQGAGVGLVNILSKAVSAVGCTTTINRTIFVNPLPVISLNPAGTVVVCQGSCTTITATLSVPVTGAFFTLFNTTNGLPVLSNSTGVFEVCTDGTYRVMVQTGPCGDTSSASVTVSVTTLPPVVAGSDTILCRNSGLFTLVGSPAGFPFITRWVANGVTLPGNQFDPSTAPAQSTVRYVIQNGACADSASKIIAVTDPVVATLAASQTASCNTPVTLTASPSGGNFLYIFSKDGIPQTNPAGPSSPIFVTSATGAYSVTVIPVSGGGTPACGDTSASISITVDSLSPIGNLLTLVNLTSCRNDASLLLPNDTLANVTTTWLPRPGVVGPVGGLYFFNPTQAGPGIHTLVVEVSNGSCVARDSILAGVGSTPIFSVKHTDASTCVSGDGTATIVFGTPGSNLGVSIFPPPPTGNITRTTDSVRVTGLQPGLYSATVSNPVTLCDTTISFRIGNPTTFRARITGVDTAYCVNSDPIIATGSPNGTRPTPFTLSGTPEPRPNPTVIDPALLTPGIYTLSYEQDSAGCLAIDSVKFRIRPLPVADIINDTITVCAGQSATFNAVVVPGATNYSWRNPSNGDAGNGPSPTSNPVTDPGVYSLTIEAGNCTSNTVFGFLRALPAPVANINVVGNDSACIGGSITLTATGAGTSYQWQLGGSDLAGQTNSSITVNQPGNYTVILSNGVCSDTSDVQTLTFTNKPSARVTQSGSLTFCQGDSVTLTGPAGNITYQWVDVSGNTLATTQAYTIRDARTVQLRVTDRATSCDSTSSFFTTVVQPRPLRGISILGDTTFCTGGVVTLTADEPSGTYQWEGIASNSRTVQVTQSGLYRVILNPGGCSDTSRFVEVTVDTVPTARILEAGPISICQGTTTILNAQVGNGNTYQWQIGGIDQTGATNSSFTLPTSTANSYTVTVIVTAGGACRQTSQPVNVTVNPTPQATIFALTDTSICPGGTVILGGNNIPGTVPHWFLDGVGDVSPTPPSNFLTATQGGFYSYILVQGPCSDTSRKIEVKVPNIPKPFAGDDRIVCITDPTFSLTGYTPPISATVQFSGPGIVAGTDQFNPLIAGQGVKPLILTRTEDGCSVRDTVLITVVPSFTVSIDPSAITICKQATTTLTATITPREPSVTYTFQWLRNGREIFGATGESYTAALDSNYTVRVSGGTCSVTSPQAVVSYFPFANVDIGPDTVRACRSDSTFTFRPSITPGSWQSDGNVVEADGSVNLATTAAGSYTVIYTYTSSQSGCSIRDTAVLVVNDNPTVNVTFLNVTTGVQGQPIDMEDEIRLTATPTPGATYTWDPTTVTPGQAPNEVTDKPLINTVYTVTVRNPNGCIATGSVTVTVLTDVRVANAFTPNGDGDNDTWNIYNIGAHPNADIKVYNRWGATVYESKGFNYTNKPWDGTQSGAKLPIGAYYYVVDLNDNTKPYIGDVTLVR